MSERSPSQNSTTIAGKQLTPSSTMEAPYLLEVGFGFKETLSQMVTMQNLMKITHSQS